MSKQSITVAARGLAQAIQGESDSHEVDAVAASLEVFAQAIADEVVTRLTAQPKVTEKLRDILQRPARAADRCSWREQW